MGLISTEPTLADVIARHEQDASLTPNRRRDLKSAVLRMSEITGVDPRITPASLRYMRPRINAVGPAKFNLTPRLDRHLVRPGGPRSLWQIDIPPHEVKNDQPLVHELPRRVTALLDRYLRRFRPALAEPGNPYLFPVGSTRKGSHGLSQQIRRVLADWVGIYMTPHQFRHFAGRVMQQHSPGAFAAIAQLLGHKDVRTTIAYYAELDTLSAGRQFDAFLEAELHKARLRGRRQ